MDDVCEAQTKNTVYLYFYKYTVILQNFSALKFQ